MQKYPINIVFVHSFNSDTNVNRPWLWEVCDKFNIPRIMPEFQPIRSNANYDDWEKIADVYHRGLSIDHFGENTMVVGHSLGNLFLIKYIAKNNIRLESSVFLAGFLSTIPNRPDIDDVVKKFMPTKEEIEKFKKLVPRRFAIYDLNDPLLNPIDFRTNKSSMMEEFADILEAQKYVVDEGGHFGNTSKAQEIPILSLLIEEYYNRRKLEIQNIFVDIMKSTSIFGDWKDTIMVQKNGFDLWIPKNNNEVEGYFYVNSYLGHDCYAYDSVSRHTYMVINGEGKFNINNIDYPVSKGSIVTINPGDIFYYKGQMQLIEHIEPNFKDENFHVVKKVLYNSKIKK